MVAQDDYQLTLISANVDLFFLFTVNSRNFLECVMSAYFHRDNVNYRDFNA